jgi:hypothetical protein
MLYAKVPDLSPRDVASDIEFKRPGVGSVILALLEDQTTSTTNQEAMESFMRGAKKTLAFRDGSILVTPLAVDSSAIYEVPDAPGVPVICGYHVGKFMAHYPKIRTIYDRIYLTNPSGERTLASLTVSFSKDYAADSGKIISKMVALIDAWAGK